MTSTHPRRCNDHGLAAAPDGLCVLCRRQAGASSAGAQPDEGERTALSEWGAAASTPPRRSPLFVLPLLIGGAALVAAAGSWGKPYFTNQAAPRMAAAAPLAEPEPGEPSAEAQREIDRAKARDLAASLKMLEQAEAQRLELERRARARAQEQSRFAAAQREAEERERDAARHRAVMRDLESQALAGARRNVQITMYSTEWCGVCKRARKYMQAERIPFTDLDIERDASARARALALNPRGSVPTITIDQELLVGFSPDSLESRIKRAARKRSQ